jgi:hypothetical protein
MPVPVWGWADKGEEVTVTLGTQSRSTKADDRCRAIGLGREGRAEPDE